MGAIAKLLITVGWKGTCEFLSPGEHESNPMARDRGYEKS
jgi:hypothetical protein